jgi:hypothetical protein
MYAEVFHGMSINMKKRAALRAGQIFISSGAAGLGGEDFIVPGPRWWVLDVPRKSYEE